MDMTTSSLIDTHTHFDLPDYDKQRQVYIDNAIQNGIRHIILIGYVARHFGRMITTQQTTHQLSNNTLGTHLAMGLHPAYIDEHSEADLISLEHQLKAVPNIAIAEIGLDTYLPNLKEQTLYAKQQRFFNEQLIFAKTHDLPIMLHIRKSHADTLALLKQAKFDNGGIAHSFSGGEQEAFAFIKAGFKLGVTGQLTNPNAKKLRRTIHAVLNRYGVSAFVLETDCPDMTPLPYHHLPINEPATLPCVLDTLAQLANMDKTALSDILWHNTCQALNYSFTKTQSL